MRIYKSITGTGRKRYLLVDTEGLMLGCHVTSANIGDRDGAKGLLRRVWLTLPRLSHIWADGNYDASLVKPADQKGFLVLPRR